MISLAKLNPEFIVDHKGVKRAVILPIEEYEQLIEDIHDLAVIAERRDEDTLSHSRVMEELKRDGYISD